MPMIGTLLKSCVLNEAAGRFAGCDSADFPDCLPSQACRKPPVRLSLEVRDGVVELSISPAEGYPGDGSSFVAGLSVRNRSRLARNAGIWGQCCSGKECCYSWPVEKLAKLVTPSANRGLYAVTVSIVFLDEQAGECGELWRSEELVSFYL